MAETKEQKAARMHVYNQRPEVKKRAALRMRSRRKKINDLIRAERSKPCADCGIELPPEIMEFDHVRGEPKRFAFCSAASFTLEPGEDRLSIIQAEIAKCEVRCPNCHKLRHFTEKNGHFTPSGPYMARG